MNRLNSLFVPLIAVCLLLLAPTADAQVPTPTQQDIQQERMDLQQRMDRLDQRFEQMDQRIRTTQDAQQRTDFERHFSPLQQQRAEVRRQMQTLDDVGPDQWRTRFDPVHQQVTELERGFDEWAGQMDARPRTPTDPRTQAHPTMAHHQVPTEAQMQQHRTDLQARVDRFDRDLAGMQRTMANVRDEQRRSQVQATYDQLTQQRQAMQDDLTAFQNVTAADFHGHHRNLADRLGEMETAALQARLRTADTRDAYRRSLRQTLDRHQDRFSQYHREIRDLPDDRRAEAAYELIQLRGQYDDLNRRYHTLSRADQATFTQQRTQLTRDLADLDTRTHEAWGTITDARFDATAAATPRN